MSLQKKIHEIAVLLISGIERSAYLELRQEIADEYGYENDMIERAIEFEFTHGFSDYFEQAA